MLGFLRDCYVKDILTIFVTTFIERIWSENSRRELWSGNMQRLWSWPLHSEHPEIAAVSLIVDEHRGTPRPPIHHH